MRVPRKEYARSRHQRLFEENVGKTGKDAIYELLSERFGSCIYARGRSKNDEERMKNVEERFKPLRDSSRKTKIGEMLAAQLAQASSARPGEQGCFLQKQPPSGGTFWRAQMGLGAICTPIFTKMTKLGLCLSSGPLPLDDKRVRITVRYLRVSWVQNDQIWSLLAIGHNCVCLAKGMTKLGLCLSSGPPPLDDKRVRITVRYLRVSWVQNDQTWSLLAIGQQLCLNSKGVRITVRMTKLGLCLSSGPPPLDDKRVRITVRYLRVSWVQNDQTWSLLAIGQQLCLNSKGVRITVRMTKLGLCLSSGPPPLDDKRVRITVRYLRVSWVQNDQTWSLLAIGQQLCLNSKGVRITVRYLRVSWVQNDQTWSLLAIGQQLCLNSKGVQITVRMTKLGLCLSSGPPPLDDKRVRITVRYLRVSWVQNDQTWSLLAIGQQLCLPSKGVQITVRYLRVSWVQNDQTWSLLAIGQQLCLPSKGVQITVRMTKLGLCLSSGPPPLDDKRVRITVRYLRVSSGPPPLDDTRDHEQLAESPTVATYPSAGGRRVTRGMRVPRKEYARSRHQRLFEENVGKTGKDAIYELLSERFGSCIYARGRSKNDEERMKNVEERFKPLRDSSRKTLRKRFGSASA
ncbi:hypothetical protein HKD37_20G056298 [Glycine soja]